MDILKNLNEKIRIADIIIGQTTCDSNEDAVRQVLDTSPIPLPEDYIDLLKAISGNAGDKGNGGVRFEIKIEDDTCFVQIYSVQEAIKKRLEYQDIYSNPLSNGIIDQIWLIGNDLGDLHYFYGKGDAGFGLYVAEDSAIYFEDADKIADTLTDFLVHGVGIKTAFWIN